MKSIIECNALSNANHNHFRSRRPPWAKANWISLLRRRSEQAVVEVTAYAYRRAFAARLIAAGVSIEDVAGTLGNTTTVALRAYVDLTAQSERLRQAARRG